MVRLPPRDYPHRPTDKCRQSQRFHGPAHPHQNPAGQGTPEASARETRLTLENLAWVDEEIKEPGWAKQFLIFARLLDSKVHWNPSYWAEDGEAGSK